MPAKFKRAAVAKGKRKSGATTAARAPGSVRQNNRPLFEKMIETLPFNIIGTDADFIIRYLNPSTLRTLKTLEPLLPVKVEQIAGHPLELFHKALAPQGHGRSEVLREADIRLGPETLH